MNQRKEIEPVLIGMAMKDMAFRKRLLENPGEVIKNEMGAKIPDTVKIKVLEEDPQTIYLVLPRIIATGAVMELTDSDLEAVAGGNDYSCSPNCYY